MIPSLADMEDAIRVAQVTYLLEHGDKEAMVTVIPAAWVLFFPGHDYSISKDAVAPYCQAAAWTFQGKAFFWDKQVQANRLLTLGQQWIKLGDPK